MSLKSLQQIWQELADAGYESDKGSVHNYISVYEELLAPYRETALNVLEIGLFRGDSLRMWEQYFTKAKVWGIDCSETPHDGMADLRPMIESGKHNIHIYDAESFVETSERFMDIRFDVIIEDAGHHISQQLKIYEVFKHFMNNNGLYIIEDIQDLDKDIKHFETIGKEKQVRIIDNRFIQQRYDECLILIKDK